MGTGITGLNHVTLAVTDVERSVSFYRNVLGCTVRVVWPAGAYLEAGSLWLCLSQDDAARARPHADYTHVAFSVSEIDFDALRERIAAECVIWRDNQSEGASTYFLDPDGHKLEIHVGALETGLSYYRERAPEGMRIYDHLGRLTSLEVAIGVSTPS